jgi:uncharacterized membrane protein YcaP (DUF421 family)
MDVFNKLFTAPGEQLDPALSALRSAIVYLLAIALVRFGKKRFFAQATAFEMVIGVMLGSVLSRAINGGGGLVPCLAAAAALVAMHWLCSFAAFRIPLLSNWLKGHTYVLVTDGKLDEKMMRDHHLTDEDLSAAMRRRGVPEDVTLVKKAVLETNGEISVVT